MKRFILFFLFISSNIAVFAQTISVNWSGTTVLDYGTEKFTVPFLTGPGFYYENGSIAYRLTQPFTGTTKKITNLSWEKISAKELYDLQYYSLPTENKFETSSYTNPYSQEKTTNFRVETLKFENGNIYRLTSFQITEEANSEKYAVTAANFLNTENPLRSGTFFKIKVDKSGIFKITSKFLRDNGINISSFNPKNFRIYGNGGVMLPENNRDFRYDGLQENAIQVVGESDGVWNEEDYALFYAQGPHGFNLYKTSPNAAYNANKRIETRTDASANVVNIYEDYAYYYINFDKGAGKRVQISDEELGGETISRYDAFQYLNEEKFNLMKIGRVWTGDAFSRNKSVNFTTNSPIQPTDVIKYRSRVIGFQSPGNKISINLNNQNERSFSLASSDKRQFAPIIYSGTVTNLQGNQFNFNYTPDTSSNPNGKFYFDYAEIQYKEDLKFNNTQMNFRSFDIEAGSGKKYTFNLSDAGSVDQVWDVSDITNAVKKTNKGTGSNFIFGFTAGNAQFSNEFVAFKNSEAFSPFFVGKVENQDLAGLQNIDYLMLTVPKMMAQAQRLAKTYEGKYNVSVVDINKVYNEFSSGSKDITGIRDFITKLNAGKKLKYVFLLGDTSFDFRGKIYPGSDIVPSYQSEESGNYSDSFVTDDYFVMTSPQVAASTSLSATLPDLPIGRLPAANVAEAQLLIDKTLAYKNALPGQSSPFGEWRMKLDFVVDDDADNGRPFHSTMNASLVNVFEKGLRSEYNVRKLYLDAFPAENSAGGQRYPQVNQAISNDVGNSLYLFYFGHGGINGWAQERVLTIDQIQNFSNFNNVYSRFPLVSTITCEFTLWDDPGTFSAGEQVIKLKRGGAATMITSSRAIGVNYGEEFTTIFTKHIFELKNDDFINLGDSFLQAKIEKGPSSDHLKVNFLGDPASKLSRPERLISIDNVDSPVKDKIRALDFVKINGHVKKADGTIDTNFNGRVAVNIFDKRLQKKTLNNDGNPLLTPVLTYTEEGSPIVKSSGIAKNGAFSVEFYVPKDINYEDGNGRMLVYADNKQFDVFQNQTQKIGGINPEGINDQEAPKVRLFMNNTNFADGGITDQNPLFLACVTDNTGINSTGAGIGHDVTVILDGKVIETVVLNDFYFSGDGNGCSNPSLSDYQKGNVSYPFRNLEPGNHQITFKVWDINNNSTTTTLNFIVKDEADQKLVVNKLLNWPNPFTNKTYVQFEHNCDDLLDVNVQIYTITGKLVRTLSSVVSAEPFLQGFRTPRTAIEWDGRDDFGDSVGKGTYIFKIFARSQNQDKCKGSATAVEKMVLLK
ncbi:type IX secretion system sortase PorU [Kaistella daneshvariae]|uniref:Type IX secretion system sortase PorU n=1 Tax=Kaistella daneshvariae TaxID=2487074 RepID=A0ABN5SV70_9FLAO|nr:type IX secretion system sortase PorU [Kaistella daneshvariae]AZI66339.1 type IX secretion system sortase PorU [Kaistella daneshvariae]